MDKKPNEINENLIPMKINNHTRVQNKHSNLVGHLQKMSPCI